MILLNKFIYTRTRIYNKGYRLAVAKYNYNSMIITRGKFVCDKINENVDFIVRYSSDIYTKNYSSTMKRDIYFHTKQFHIDFCLEKVASYHMVLVDIPRRVFIHVMSEKIKTQAAIYKFYFNICRNNTDRYRNLRGNYEM